MYVWTALPPNILSPRPPLSTQAHTGHPQRSPREWEEPCCQGDTRDGGGARRGGPEDTLAGRVFCHGEGRTWCWGLGATNSFWCKFIFAKGITRKFLPMTCHCLTTKVLHHDCWYWLFGFDLHTLHAGSWEGGYGRCWWRAAASRSGWSRKGSVFSGRCEKEDCHGARVRVRSRDGRWGIRLQDGRGRQEQRHIIMPQKLFLQAVSWMHCTGLWFLNSTLGRTHMHSLVPFSYIPAEPIQGCLQGTGGGKVALPRGRCTSPPPWWIPWPVGNCSSKPGSARDEVSVRNVLFYDPLFHKFLP